MAQEAPQLHNLKEAYRRMYKAMNIDDIETLLVPDKQPQNLTPMQENRNILMNIKLEAIPEMDHQAHIQGHLQMLAQPSIQNNIEFASNLIQDIIAHISFIAQQTQNPVQTELELFAQIAPQLANVKGDNVTRLQDRQLDIEQEDNRMKVATDLVQTESKERIEDGKLAGDIIRGDINERVEVFKTATSATNGNQNSQN